MSERSDVRTRRDTFLLVDDRDEIVGSTSSFLESLGIRYVSAASVEEALGILKKEHERISDAFIDKVMGREGGLDAGLRLIEYMRQEWPEIKCHLVTAWRLTEEEEERLASLRVETFDKGFFTMEVHLLREGLPIRPGEGLDAGASGDGEEEQPPEVEVRELKERLYRTEHEQRATANELRRYRELWARISMPLVDQLRKDLVRRETDGGSPGDEDIIIGGEAYTLRSLIDEVEQQTELGQELVDLHLSIVDDLLEDRRRGS